MKTKLKKNFNRMLPIGRVNYKCRDRDSRLEVSLGIPNCTAERAERINDATGHLPYGRPSHKGGLGSSHEGVLGSGSPGP